MSRYFLEYDVNCKGSEIFKKWKSYHRLLIWKTLEVYNLFNQQELNIY